MDTDSRRTPLETLTTAARRRAKGLPVWRWFDERVTTKRAAFGLPVGKLLDAGDAASTLAEGMNASRADRRRRVYVRLPVCCRRCGERSQVGQTMSIESHWYVHAVIEQIKRMSQTAWTVGGPIGAICIGGGATRLPAPVLAEIVDRARRSFIVTEDCEVTVETLLPVLDAAYLRSLVDAGVTHLRFAVESLDDPLRRYRKLSGDRSMVLMAIELAKTAGLTISVDVLYGMPLQTPGRWPEDIETLLAVGVDGITIDPAMRDTPEGSASDDTARADDAACFAQHHRYTRDADALLASRDGWERVSPVHYARRGALTHRYRTHRDETIDVLGIGLGASGEIDGLTYFNVAPFEQYLRDQSERVDRHLRAVAAHRTMRDACPWYELVETGSTTHRVTEVGGDALRFAAGLMEDAGLIECDARRVTLTDSGRFWAWTIGRAVNRLVVETVRRACRMGCPRRRHRGASD